MRNPALILFLTIAAGLPVPAAGQQFTTAAEVRPILEATRANWIGIREYDGRDLIYFTHLLAWRCGLSAVRFSVNADPAVYSWPMEPCYEGTAAPNAILSPEVLPYVEMPLGTAQSVSVTLELDDGSIMTGEYARAAVRIP